MHILLIEDNPDDAEIIRSLLTDSQDADLTFEWVQQLSLGIERLSQVGAEVVLLDLSLPDSYGMDTFTQLQAENFQVPIIVLTGLDNEALGIEIVERGGQDYMVKGHLNERALRRSLHYAKQRHDLFIALQDQTLALRASEQNLLTIINSNNNGMVIVEQEDIIRFLNPAAEALLGHTCTSLIGTRLPIPRIKNNLKELDIPHCSGETKVVEIESVPITWENQSATLITLHDVTKRKEAERTVAHQAEKLARSNSELEQFTSIASHDLQEPLRKVQAFSTFLGKAWAEGRTDQAQEYLQRIQRSVGQMQILIRDLLDFCSIGKQDSAREPVDLADLVLQVAEDFEVKLGETGGQIIIEPLPIIKANPGEIRQLFQNLIGNALKFQTPGVPPLVKITARPMKKEHHLERTTDTVQSLWHISIEDNGIGFDEEYQERIFVMFQRLHGHAQYEGTGVGLAICRKVVERLGGCIDAKGQQGEGATFTITLPVDIHVSPSTTQNNSIVPNQSLQTFPSTNFNNKAEHLLLSNGCRNGSRGSRPHLKKKVTT